MRYRCCCAPARTGETWSRWYTVALERVAEEGGEEKAFTEPIWTGAGRYLQVSARQAGDGGAAPARLRDVNVVAINSTEDADRASAVVGVLRRAATTVAGFRLTPAAAAMTTKPEIVTRSEWGANESWRSGSPDYAPVKMAFVHHTDSGNDYTAAEAPAVVRGVYAYHAKSLHWSDVGYNFLIDRYGTIYEGRYGGVTRGVTGAQVLGFNTGSTGISVIGTFTTATPPSAVVTSLERLLEWKLDVHHVDPLGTERWSAATGRSTRTGQRVAFPAIAGHRDANYTDCPGGQLYAQLPNVRKVVARTGQPKIYGFIVEDPDISPNGDGVRDRATIGFTVSQTATWRLDIRDDAGTLVRHMTGEGTIVETTWEGRDDAGNLLADGVYSLQADATSSDGEARSATATLRLDTVAPDITSATVAPDPFSPNGDGQDDIAVFEFEPGEAGTARLSVVAADGSRAPPGDGLEGGHHGRPEGRVGRPHLIRRGPHRGAGRGSPAAGRAPRRGGEHHQRPAQGHGRPNTEADLGLARDVLAQRRRRQRRCDSLVPAHTGRGRDRHRGALRLHGQDDASRPAGRRRADRGVGRQTRWRGRGDERSATRSRWSPTAPSA